MCSDVAQFPWQENLLLTRDDRPRAIVANAVHALRYAPELSGIIAYDDFSHRIMAIRRVPWDKDSTERREWTTADDIALQVWLQNNGVQIGSIATVMHGVLLVAKDHSFHPVRDYLDSLLWDGVERLDRWLTIYAGAADSAYTRMVGAKFAIGAVARIYDAGCQLDAVLMLEGRQGSGKTAMVRVLGTPWVLEGLPDLHSRETQMQIQGAWLIELAELSALRKSDIESMKAFVTRKVDRFRTPYETRAEDHPRQCVFIGTTNSFVYLSDMSGNRRFWPVRCGRIDVEAIQRDRDQLWAEATQRYLDGESWHPANPEEVEAAALEQESRRIPDPWEDLIEVYLLQRQHGEVFVRDVLEDALSIPSHRINTAHGRRVNEILQRLGWQKQARKQRQGRREQCYRYVGNTSG